MASTKVLFEPLRLGPLTLRNRIVVPALTRNRSVPTNVPNEVNVEHYRQRAAGGADLIITEGIKIYQHGTEWPNAPGIWSQEQVVGWKKVTEAVHKEDGLIFAQLWHVGRLSHPETAEQKEAGEPVWGPSAIPARGGKFRFLPGEPGYVTPTAIDDPNKFIMLFRKAAINAKEAGFDGVQLLGGNGYLLSQFLDSGSNLRTDKWGGSVENRARFVLETIKAVSDVFGADRVAIKLSPAGGYNDMGMPLQETIDTFGYLITEADKLGVAFFEITRYKEAFDPRYDGTLRGTPHDVISTFSPFIKNAALIGNGQFTPEEAATFISEGKMAAVSFGILSLAHPDLAKRIKYGKPLDNVVDPTTLYGAGGDLQAQIKGYNDYPFAKYD